MANRFSNGKNNLQAHRNRDLFDKMTKNIPDLNEALYVMLKILSCSAKRKILS